MTAASVLRMTEGEGDDEDLSGEEPSDLGFKHSEAGVTVKFGTQFLIKLRTRGDVQERSWIALVVVFLIAGAFAFGVDALLHGSGEGEGWPAVGITLAAAVLALVFGTWFLGRFVIKRVQ